MKDTITFNIEVTVPEFTKSVDINFSRGAFKEAVKVHKFKRDMIKAQLRLISRYYNNAPIKYGVPSVPYEFRQIHRELIKQEVLIKWNSRILFLAYAFVRGIPRHVVEKKAETYSGDVNNIVNGIRDRLSFDNLLSSREGLSNKIKEWYLKSQGRR